MSKGVSELQTDRRALYGGPILVSAKPTNYIHACTPLAFVERRKEQCRALDHRQCSNAVGEAGAEFDRRPW